MKVTLSQVLKPTSKSLFQSFGIVPEPCKGCRNWLGEPCSYCEWLDEAKHRLDEAKWLDKSYWLDESKR